MMEQRQIWYTARDVYDRTYDATSWDNYVKWSRIFQLEELVSLDGLLNGAIFEPDFNTEIEEVIIVENRITDFFRSMDYVQMKSSHMDRFNLLAVIKNPISAKQVELEKDFDFIGYDLIEIGGGISALTNCGGFDETFLPKELNKYGLITDYDRAKNIQLVLPQNNPNEYHADCDVYEVWRHKIIGRKI